MRNTPDTKMSATNNELGFDYLRDNMRFSKEEMVQGHLSFAILDEVDSILIDEARTPLDCCLFFDRLRGDDT